MGKAAARGRVIVLDDEANMGKILTKLLRLEGFEVEAFVTPREALASLEQNGADVLLTDLRMPELSGEEVLETVREKGYPCEVILMTAYGTVESAMRCVHHGAFDYVTKPFDSKALVQTVRQAAEKRGKEAPTSPPPAAENDRELRGDSAAMKSVRGLIEKFARTESPVIIYGESGTGKELAARAIHRLSSRASDPFVAINCASIPENLMESELFGHEKGAFTGAHERKTGLMEAADGGTLFLDEIGDLPLGLQAKLLRALQEKEISRVGSVENIPIDNRIVAATNRQLDEAVKNGTFREDLYYRLNVLAIKMPSLRKRVEDIPPLATHFLEFFRHRTGKGELEISPDVLEHMKQMEWPGNVRELQNFVERLVVLSEGPLITEKDVFEMATSDSQVMERPSSLSEAWRPEAGHEEIAAYREARERFEADYLRAVLRASGGNVSEAAKKSGISRRSFYEKIEKLNIDPGEFK